MFVPQRSHSAPPVVFPPVLEPLITQEEKTLIQACAYRPEIRNNLRSIVGYSRSKMQQAITKNVISALNDYGVTQFGKTASGAKVMITSFLEEIPELKDENTEKCLTKIVYFFSLSKGTVDAPPPLGVNPFG